MVDHISHFLFTKRNIYYFSRRVPQDVRSHYNRERIVVSLRTKSRKAAETRAARLATKLDEDWLALRWRSSDNPLVRFLANGTSNLPINSTAPTMSEAKEIYLQAKAQGRSRTFTQGAERSIGYLIELLGDKPLDTYARQEVNLLRDELLGRGLSKTSVRRNFNTIKAIINFATRELGFPDTKVFSGVYLGEDSAQGAVKRTSIPVHNIAKIQRLCRQLDDEQRWLVALISDTGMRLSEAVGVVSPDVFLDHEYPHIKLLPHPWRRLKTNGSERIIPLVGASLWAAKRASGKTENSFLFPSYCSEDGSKSNSASGALNKWLRPRVPEGCVIHSFRHSMRDRLRTVECPSVIIDRIGGWTTHGVGERYGEGYPIKILYPWMSKITLSG